MDINKFKNWLIQNGCEVEPPTNAYETIRWKGAETGVIYTTGKFSGPYAQDAVYCFKTGKKWNGGAVKVGRKTYVKQKIKLLARDGTKCFLCDQELGEDITVDHLVPLVAGGPNHLSNMVLMHEKCNGTCGAMSVVEKVKIAVNNRIKEYDQEMSYNNRK